MTNRTEQPTRLQRTLRAGRTLGMLALPALVVAAMEGQASAQEWLKDRRYQEGAGIRTGDVELHPGIGGEIGYDSNWFLRSSGTDPRIVNGGSSAPPVEGGVLRITPSFTVSTVSGARAENPAGGARQSPSVAFRGNVAATYREFLFGGDELSKQRNLSGASNVRLDILPNRPVGVGLFAGYTRLVQPSVVADPTMSFNRSDVTVGGEIIALPGGGTLDVRGGYRFYGALFEESSGVPFTNLTHELSLRNRWRFRPRTALFHDTSLRFVSYPSAERALNYLNDSTPLRTRFGLTGLLTDRFGTLLAAGYGSTFFKNPEAASSVQYDSINAQAEGTFYLSGNTGSGEPGQATLLLSTISLGFVRDFQNSLLGNFYTSNKGYAKAVYFFGGKTLLQLDGYVEALDYPDIYYNSGVPNGAPVLTQASFTNIRAGATFFAEHRLSSSFGLNGSLDYIQMFSDTLIPASAGPTGNLQLFDLAYHRFQAFVGARWFL